MGRVKRELRVRAALREPCNPILLDPIDVQIGAGFDGLGFQRPDPARAPRGA